jgi:ureidoacrylate peracid hydrolase
VDNLEDAPLSSAIRTINLDAKPQQLQLDIARTAVLVIDMQNEFGSKGGMFDRAGIDITIIRRVIEPTAAVLDAARRSGIPIIYLKMQHRKDLADLGANDSPHHIKHMFFGVGDSNVAPDGSPNRVLVEGYWGTEIISELSPGPKDIIVSKHRYSGFFETELDGILRGLGIKQLIVTGCTTSVCVESTIRDAMFRDYRCCLLSDCSAEPIGMANSRGNHEASLLTVELLLGWVSNSKQFIDSLSKYSAKD